MKTIINRLHRFFFQPSSAAPFAFLRIGTAIIALLQLAWLCKDIPLLYGEQGMVQWSLSNGIVSTHFPRLSWMMPLAKATHTTPNTWVFIMMSIYAVSLLVLLLGKYTRPVAFVAWWLHFMLINTGFLAAYGVETFLHIAMTYCIIMPAGKHYSLDALRKPPAPPQSTHTLGLRVIQLHLCIVYLASGIEKARGEQWWNGEAIWQTLMQTQFSRWDMSWLANYPILATTICWLTLLVECGYPLWMWSARIRPYGYLAVASLHIGIAVCMGLQLFAAMMILLNTTAWAAPWLTKWLQQWQYKRNLSRLRHTGLIATQACCFTDEETLHRI